MFWKRKNKKKDALDGWPEMVMVSREFFAELIKKEAVCRFIEDMNQGLNGDLHLPSTWLYEAAPVIQECTDKIMEHLDKNSTIVDDKGKIKILGLKLVDGKVQEVKA